MNFWKWSGESRCPGALSPLLENFRPAFPPDLTDCPWVSEDEETHAVGIASKKATVTQSHQKASYLSSIMLLNMWKLHWKCAHSQADSFVRFKFLHRVGAKSFDWPRRDDVDDVHISCVFYGPVTLESAGPFAVPKQQNIEKKV